MHFPTFLNEGINFRVEVIPNIEEACILPRKYRLMPTASVTYKITSNVTTLPAPVRVRIQHCAIVEKEDSLVFMMAHDGPPYHFQLWHGGKFPPGESYGEIKVEKFSFFTIFNNVLDMKMSLAVFVAYLSNNIVHFLVTKNLPANCTQVKNEYLSIELDKYAISYYYSTTNIALKVIQNFQDSWLLEPVCQPACIDMRSVHAYEPGCVIPKIELKLEWKGAGEPGKKKVKIAVEGRSFILFCGVQPPRPVAMFDKPTLPLLQHLPTPSGDAINIIRRIGESSHNLGIRLLNDTYGDITANIEAKYRPDQCRITAEIFRKWFNGTGRTPQSWATLVTLLREMQMAPLALEIEQSIVSL